MSTKIYLIGLPGSGKSTIGQLLAKSLQNDLCDIDQLIETRQNQTINEIFAEKGEEYFRELESETLQEIINSDDDLIVSTGGGIIIKKSNRELLAQQKYTVFCHSTPKAIYKRISGDKHRPLLQNADAYQKLSELYNERCQLYLDVAKTTINTETLSPSDAANSIIKWLEQKLY